MSSFKVLIFLLCSILFASESEFSLGPGFMIRDNYREQNQLSGTQDDPIIKFIPSGSIKYKGLQVRGPNIQYTFFKLNRMISFHTSLSYSGDKYQGTYPYHKRKNSLFAGFGGKLLFLNFKFKRDILGINNGDVFTIGTGFPLFVSEELTIISGFNIEYLSDRYTHYYYSVENDEVNLARSEYHPNSEHNYNISLRIFWTLNERIKVTNMFTYKLLGQQLRSSPTVNDSKALMWISGISYRLF